MNPQEVVLKLLLDKFGQEAQIMIAIEEMSELIKELCKYKRYGDNETHIVEELADVQLLLNQLKVIFNCNDDVDRIMNEKLNRAVDRYNLI